jgi:hypothetical protein
MGVVNRCCDVYFGKARSRRFNRNKVNNSKGWLCEVRIIEAKFKLVKVKKLKRFEEALEVF